MDRALDVAWSMEQFPWTVLRPSSESSGDARASRMAQASSMPGSVSKRIRFGISVRVGAAEGFYALKEQLNEILPVYVHGSFHVGRFLRYIQNICKCFSHGNTDGDIHI